MTKTLSPSQRLMIRNIADALAQTDYPGLSGSTVQNLLHDIEVPLQGGGNKRETLFASLTNTTNGEAAVQRTHLFIEAAMSPARFIDDRQRWEELRRALNSILVTEGWKIDDAGNLIKIHEQAHSFDDIDRLTNTLLEELQRRNTHDILLEYCNQELIAQSLFHAISEASKSIPDRIRNLTGLQGDGQNLYDEVFGTGTKAPRILINAFYTESEQSAHKGFKNLLVGIHGHFRNPRAHSTRLGSEENKHDFLDAFSLFSYVHRCLDDAKAD